MLIVFNCKGEKRSSTFSQSSAAPERAPAEEKAVNEFEGLPELPAGLTWEAKEYPEVVNYFCREADLEKLKPYIRALQDSGFEILDEGLNGDWEFTQLYHEQTDCDIYIDYNAELGVSNISISK